MAEEKQMGVIAEEALDEIAGGLKVDKKKLISVLKYAGVGIGIFGAGVAAGVGLGVGGTLGTQKGLEAYKNRKGSTDDDYNADLIDIDDLDDIHPYKE